MRFLRNKKGFTLIELVVAMVVFAILGGAVAGMIQSGLNSYGKISDDIYTETEARTALSLITVQIRQHDATDAITVDTPNKVIRLRNNPASATDLSGTVIWFSVDTLYSAQVEDTTAALPGTGDEVTKSVAKIHDITLSQGVAPGGTAFDYTITVSYTDTGAKQLSQTVTQRSAPADPSPTT